MIIYHPAFDLYHSIFRMVQLLAYFDKAEDIEIDRLRIWDYYLLFPNKLRTIKLTREEKDIKLLIERLVPKEENPYQLVYDDRKMFERIRPFQMMALKCLASYGIISKDYLQENRVKLISKEQFDSTIFRLESVSVKEQNVIKLMTSHFYLMSLFGPGGLKERSRLLESRYDAQ